MRDYLMKIKNICDNLANCGDVISEHEHIMTVLNGLPPEYDSIITAIAASATASDLTVVTTILLDAKARQGSIVESVTDATHTVSADFQQTNNSFSSQNNSQNLQHENNNYAQNNRGRGRGWSSSRLQCQLCGRLGHLVDKCYCRFDKNFKNESARNSQSQGYSTNQANICTYNAHGSVSSHSCNSTHPCRNIVYTAVAAVSSAHACHQFNSQMVPQHIQPAAFTVSHSLHHVPQSVYIHVTQSVTSVPVSAYSFATQYNDNVQVHVHVTAPEFVADNA
ncbi:uncharacterized protein LOC120177231 [Hibiscus syriacus]|uniref:uncharacterized protein LOC120177231 n=1 Tax=Hibiscus syriacus TaxID=106335 RepID=UPI0019209437|nr:uncharacterized protein LOC120177231 [Hibiscus syriacus]XP_039039383.1 uncharacterized protein LOC120177231 [Hibiscus syriacus]